MEDKRNLTLGVRFAMDEGINALSAAMERIRQIKGDFLEAEDRAEAFGTQAAQAAGKMESEMSNARKESEKAASALERISDSGEDVENSINGARRAFDRFGDSSENDVGQVRGELEAAANAAGHLSKEALQGAGDMKAGLQGAEAAAQDAKEGLEDTAQAGTKVGKSYREMGQEADSFKAAVITSSAAAMKETNSLSETVKAGFQGAYGFAGKKADEFEKKAVSGAKGVQTAITHPIQTIKLKLAEALERAGKKFGILSDDAEDSGDAIDGAAKDGRTAIQRMGEEAERSGRDLGDMGNDGESAGTQIKNAIGGAVTSFFAISAAIEVVKAGFEAVKSFGAAIIETGTAAEQTGAKFNAVFSDASGVGEWADNFSEAIHRSNTEVQSFLVSNKSMYQEMGITGQAADELSKITTSLAYDFGTAFSMEDAEALSVVQDYLQGNTAAMAEYGIQIDDTALKQSAMSMGLGSNIEALDEAAMAQVRMNALLENSTEIQQAAAKKQEGYANGIKSLKSIWTDFLTSAGEKFSPVFTNLTNTILQSWPQIEPVLMGMIDALSNGLAAGIPVIMDLATTALPPLIQTLGEVFAAAAPLGSVFLDFATTALPPLMNAITPLVSTFSSLAQTILPPFSRIVANIATTVVPPLVEILQSLSENVIEPLMPSIESIANAILPAISSGLKLIPPILEVISPILSGIADILSRVVGFLSKIVEWVAGGIGTVLDKVAGIFGGGSDSVGADIPHNASGTEDFAGGWTHINERGGEIAYLPSGSTIIPADKSEEIIAGEKQRNVTKTVVFNPNIKIEVNGNVDSQTVKTLKEEIKAIVRELYEEFKEEDEMNLAIQQGNA